MALAEFADGAIESAWDVDEADALAGSAKALNVFIVIQPTCLRVNRTLNNKDDIL